VLKNKTWGKKGKGGHIELWHFSSQITIIYDGALLSWERLDICLPVGSSE